MQKVCLFQRRFFFMFSKKSNFSFWCFYGGYFRNPSCFQNLSLKGIEKMAILANIFENLDFRIGKTVYLNFVGLLQFNRDRKSRMDKFWKNRNIPVEEDDSAPTIITVPHSPPIHTPPPKWQIGLIGSCLNISHFWTILVNFRIILHIAYYLQPRF